MATSSEQVHGHQYVDFDEYIDIQLRKTSSTIKTTDVMTAVVGVLTLITLYLLLFVICDHWLVPGGFGSLTRGLMLAVVGVIACAWMAVKVIVPWRRRVSGLYAASTIEKASPALKSSLINLVDISRSGHEVSPEIYQSIERRAALALTHVDVNETVDRRSLLRLSNALLAVVVLFCLYWIFSPKNPGTSLWRAIVPSAHVGVATRTEIFNVHPGDKDVLARSQLEVTADIRGELPQQTFLFFTTADRKFVDERVEMRLENEGTRKFRCVLTGDNGAGILQNMTYRIVAGDATTPDYNIRVVQPPAATIDSIRLESPDYTRREPVTQATGPIDGLEGTRVTLKAHANMPLRSASLQFFDDETAARRAEELPITVTDGTKLQVDWKLEIRSDGTFPHYYRIYCTSAEGESDPSPSLYSYFIRPDQPPEITLRDPKTDLDLPTNAVLPLVIEGHDPDFALTYVDLIIEKDGSPVPSQTVFSGNSQQFKTTHKWQLKEHHFQPKDTITYWLEAKDNRQPIANVARTPKLRIHITKPVSEEQVQKQLASAEQRQKEEEKQSEANQPQEKSKEEDKGADNGEEKPSKQPKHKNEAGGKNGQNENGQGGRKPGEQPNEPGANGQDRQDNTNGDNGDGTQSGKNAADKDDNQPQPLNPDKKEDDAQSLNRLNKLLNEKQPDKDDNKPEKSKQDQSEQKKPDQKSEQNRSDQNSGGGDKNQPGSSSDSSQGGDNPQKKQDQGGEKPNSSENQKSETQPNGGDQTGNSKDQSQNKQDPSKGQSSNSQQKQDSHGTKSAGDQGQPDKTQGDKPSDKKNEGGNSSGQPDVKNQQPNGEHGQQPGQPQNGSSQGSNEKKNPGDQKDGKGDQKSEAERKSGIPNSEKKTPGGQNSSEQPNQSPGGQGQNSQEKGSQKPNPSNSNPEKTEGKPEGSPDKKPPQNNQDGGSNSGQEGGNNQPKNNEGQAQSGNQAGGQQPGDQKNKDGASQKPSQDNGSQNNDGSSGDRKPGEQGSQKPGEQQSGSNESGGKREQGKNEPGKRDSANQSGNNANERGDGSQQQPDDKTGQSSSPKSGRDENGQPKKAQTGNQNGDRQQQNQPQPNGANGNRDEKSNNDRGEQRQSADPHNRVNPKTPDSNRREPEEQTHTVHDNKRNQTGTAGSETDSANGSPQQGKPQQGGADNQPGRQQEQKTGGQSRQQSSEQKPGGSEQKPGGSEQSKGSQEQEGGKPQSGAQDANGKPGEPKDGQPQSGQSQSPQGQQGKGQQGKGQDGKGQQGQGQQGQGQQGQEGAKGQGQSGAGQQQGKGNQPGQSGQAGTKPSSGMGQSGAGHNGGGFNQGEGSGQGAPLEDTSKNANLDYAKKATDLVLNKLESQLKRGKVDKKIEEEMGWNQDQIRRFVERMRKEAQAAEDPNTPGSEARRLQFEETLKSLNLRATARRSSKDLSKSNDSEIESKRSIPPAEYRELYDAFTRSVAKPVPRQSDDKK
jgi:collagen type III alpha